MRNFLPSSIGSYFDFVAHIFYNQVFSDENFKNIKLNQLGKKGCQIFLFKLFTLACGSSKGNKELVFEYLMLLISKRVNIKLLCV